MNMYGGSNCYNLQAKWQLTYDGIYVNQNPVGNNGFLATYCYTKDG